MTEQTCANCVNYLTEEDARERLAADVAVANFLYEGEKARERREWRKTLGLGCVALILLLAFTALVLVGAIVI